ncbi:YfiR family protein [Opitutus sp. GAS368]|jgi:hypothetical protein|uniref:YfiR family protein n=1 Tax=Opitutus sp. GAS368 TaxID=1882749 RepID=UPI00087C38FC|nr:YfiR family protein [Opitutus sp. GAS368]SDR81669.1 protein of unknown function [Opitutus sp. GAS368]
MALLGTGRGWGEAPRLRGWLLLAALTLGGSAGEAQTPSVHEYQVKAVLLFNFTHFVEWPSTAFAGPEAPLVIGVLGADPFGPALDEAVRGEKVGARPLLIRRYPRVEDIDTCHLLFISRSEAGRLDGIVARLQNRSILTVSDAEGSALRGIMIRLVTEENRIRLRINLNAAKAAGLVLSSKLLRPAEIVTTDGK